MAKKYFNLSGHQNDALTEAGFVFPGTVQVNPTAPLQDNAQAYATWLAGLGIGSGDHLTVALPGMSSLAAIAVAAIHGLTGQFPAIVSLVRQADGTFLPGAPLDMQEFRNATARAQRPNVVQLT